MVTGQEAELRGDPGRIQGSSSGSTGGLGGGTGVPGALPGRWGRGREGVYGGERLQGLSGKRV